MLRTVMTSLGVASLLAPVAEAGPSFRYCEAGYLNRDVGLDGNASTGNLQAAFSTDDGTGFNGACKLELLMGFYVLGEYEQASFDFDAAFSGDVEEAFTSNVDSSTLRVGAGASIDVPFMPVTAYGQLAFTQVDFEGDVASIIADAGAAAFDQDETGFDVEVGARAVVFDRLDLGAYLRYSDIGSVRIPQDFSDIQTDDDIRIGGQAAYNLIGPLWGTVRYETGDTDSLFVGARVAF